MRNENVNLIVLCHFSKIICEICSELPRVYWGEENDPTGFIFILVPFWRLLCHLPMVTNHIRSREHSVLHNCFQGVATGWNSCIWLFCRVFYLVQAHRLVSFDDDKHSWKFIKQPLITDSTHWGQDKMAAFFQMTCSSLFLRVQLKVFQHWFRLWLGTGQATSHYRNQWWSIYWCIYVSLDLNWFK